MCPLSHSHNSIFSNNTGFCLVGGGVGGVCWVCTGNICSFALFLVPMWVAIFTAHHPWLFILDSLQHTWMRTTHILWRHCVYLVLLSVKCFLNIFICSHFVFIYKNLIPVARKVDDHECKFCAMSSSNITLHAFEDLLVFWCLSNVMWSSTFRGFFSVFFCNVDFRITFRKVIMQKSVGDYSGTPYVTTLLNCLLWVFYGSSAVTNTTLIISINGAGLALEAVYICIHLFYGTDESRVQIYFFTISPTKKKILFPQN